MGWMITGRLSTDTMPSDRTTIRVGKPTVVRTVVDPDPAQSADGRVNPPARGDLLLTEPVRVVRARRINTARSLAGYDFATAGGRSPTKRTLRGEVHPGENYAPIDLTQLDRLRYFWETGQRVRLREDHWSYSAMGAYTHSLRDHGDQLMDDLAITPEQDVMGVPIAVRFALTLTSLTAADITA